MDKEKKIIYKYICSIYINIYKIIHTSLCRNISGNFSLSWRARAHSRAPKICLRVARAFFVRLRPQHNPFFFFSKFHLASRFLLSRERERERVQPHSQADVNDAHLTATRHDDASERRGYLVWILVTSSHEIDRSLTHDFRRVL